MNIGNKVQHSAILLCLTLALLGCGQAKFGEVSGRVTLDGKPLPQVAVRFEDAGGSATIARTNAQGEYVLQYSVQQSGAPVGTHQVTIFTPAPESEGTGERAKAELVPARYNVNSTMTQDIKPGRQTINFELTTRP